MMFVRLCPACSASNKLSAKFCHFCGSPLSPVQDATAEAERSAAEGAGAILQENTLPEVPSCKEPRIVGLVDIQSNLRAFINTLLIRCKQRRAGMPVTEQSFVLVFRGETGTGKSLVAEWFIGELQKSGCASSGSIERTTARKLRRQFRYDDDIARHLATANPSVLLIDEVHEDEDYLRELLLGLTENPCRTICILTGIREPLEGFFARKSELADLVRFYDFPSVSDADLTEILSQKLRLSGFDFDADLASSFAACVQEIRHGDTSVYRNGWIVEKEIIPRIMEKQAARLGRLPDISEGDLKRICVDDLPVSVSLQSVEEILSMMDELIGMDSVKKAVRELCQSVQNNLRRASLGLAADTPKPHIILTGNPCTGKTTVARILGKLFHAMKLLPGDKLLETGGLDLTAGYVGQTKDKVNALCDKAMGGVLFIDEAYYLAGSDGSSNSFAAEAVGTLLKRMEDDRGKFVVIAAGYRDKMQDFLRMNPGLDSRFSYKIHIDDYTSEELFQILCLSVRKAQFVFAPGAETAALRAGETLCKDKGKDFANARAVRNLFDVIKTNMDGRIAALPPSELSKEALTTITASDIPHDDGGVLTAESVLAELDELVGMQKVKHAVRELYDTVKVNAELERMGQTAKKPEIHIVLTGNPGTGKTTVARILGRLFRAIGLLPGEKLIEADRSKIVAKYVGHTAQNVQRLCDDAMGGILFIDEVYTLATDDFGREATDTLMKRMEDDRGKFVVVVAGYAGKMDEWLSVNEGLSSRFTHRIHIDDYDEQELYDLFCLFVRKEGLVLTGEARDAARLVISRIWRNRGQDFANGRTVRKLFDAVVRKKNSRVIAMGEGGLTKVALTTIEAEDFAFEQGTL